MPFITIHKTAMKQTSKLIKKELDIDVPCGNYLNNIAIDRLGKANHGYDIINNEGILTIHIKLTYDKILNYLKHNVPVPAQDIIDLCHLITDGMTIGQIRPDLWGKRDNIIDLFGELTPKKDIFDNFILDFWEYKEFEKMYMKKMKFVYMKHKNLNLIKWNGLLKYCASGLRASMYRYAVRWGCNFTASLLKLAIRESMK